MPSPPTHPLPPLATLTRAPPHPSLPYQLLELLYGYCLVHRIHVGDWVGDEHHASASVIAACPPLWAGGGGRGGVGGASGVGVSGGVSGGVPEGVPASAEEALSVCMEAALQPPLAAHTTRAFVLAIVEVCV